MNQHGDDLEDDFVPDELAALSADEAQAIESDQEDIHALLSQDEEPLENAQPADQLRLEERKRKRREKLKEKKAKKQKLQGVSSDTSSHPSNSGGQPPRLLAEYLASKQKQTLSKSSSIELADVMIPESAIADTTLWTKERTLDYLVDFIMEALPKLHTRLGQRSKANGSPTVLFIAGAALRATDITRTLKNERLRGEKSGEVAKLFAKHFKLKEQVDHLKKTKIGAAVGTPGRVGKLLCETDALSLDALTHIVLDTTFQDAKKRSLLDIPETRNDLFLTVLGCPKVLAGIKQGNIQVVFF